jgi:hypothetical protein
MNERQVREKILCVCFRRRVAASSSVSRGGSEYPESVLQEVHKPSLLAQLLFRPYGFMTSIGELPPKAGSRGNAAECSSIVFIRRA